MHGASISYRCRSSCLQTGAAMRERDSRRSQRASVAWVPVRLAGTAWQRRLLTPTSFYSASAPRPTRPIGERLPVWQTADLCTRRVLRRSHWPMQFGIQQFSCYTLAPPEQSRTRIPTLWHGCRRLRPCLRSRSLGADDRLHSARRGPSRHACGTEIGPAGPFVIPAAPSDAGEPSMR